MNKQKRIKLIKKWLKSEPNPNDGICISFGQSVYGDYMAAPWIGWNGLIKLFPEFEIYNYNESNKWDDTQRELIFKSLTLRLNHKKDTVHQTNPELFK